jgi:acyl-CoA thioesterase-1
MIISLILSAVRSGHLAVWLAIATTLVATGQADAAPGILANEPISQTDSTTIDDLQLLDLFWKSDVARRESALFVKCEGDARATARLFFPAAQILAIRSANGECQYELGKDAELSADGRTLSLTENSRIPYLQQSALFPPAGSERSISHKAGDVNRSVLFDNAHWFHDQQIEVTYRHATELWPTATPSFAGNQLPNFMAKLRAGEPVSLGVSGDSIAAGGNASGTTKAAPGMPAFPELVAAQLERTYASKVLLHNRAVGGWTAPDGLADLDALLADKPDLIIIAYGMNDVGGRNPAAFRSAISAMLSRIREANPKIEVILVSPMLGNAAWAHTPPAMFPLYRDALASLAGPGVALADVTTLWGTILTRKREVDLTGNGVNHPNDFGHRLYAQAVLALLAQPGPSETAAPSSH